MDFHYRAVRADGTIQTGLRSAASTEQLFVLLKGDGLIPLEVHTSTKKELALGFQRVSAKELLVFTQQLSGLLLAGIRLSRSLEILTDLSRGRFKNTLGEIGRDIREGQAFSASLEKHPKIFDRAYITMVKAGEASGRLPEVLARIAESIEAEQEFMGEVLTSLLYPGLVTGVSVIGLTGLMTFVIPRFEDLFRRIGQDLPLMTKIVLSISHGMARYGFFILILFAAGIIGTFIYIGTPKGKLEFDRILVRTPILGGLILQIELERLTRMLSLLMGSGVTLLNSLLVLPDILRNRLLSVAVSEAAEAVRIGNSLARFLSTQPIFPSLAVAMIGVGEEGGNLGPMMDQVARIYARETRQAFRRLASLIGPMLIVVLAGLVFLIALAVLLPIFQLRME